MDFIKNVDWTLVGFVSASTALEYYYYRKLAWRIIIICWVAL